MSSLACRGDATQCVFESHRIFRSPPTLSLSLKLRAQAACRMPLGSGVEAASDTGTSSLVPWRSRFVLTHLAGCSATKLRGGRQQGDLRSNPATRTERSSLGLVLPTVCHGSPSPVTAHLPIRAVLELCFFLVDSHYWPNLREKR